MTVPSTSRSTAFGVDAAMLCSPRSNGKPAFVIEYICRENKIRSVSSGLPPPSRRQSSCAASCDLATGLMSIGVMPRVNKWFASVSADSDSSEPPTASPRAVRPLYLNSGMRASASAARPAVGADAARSWPCCVNTSSSKLSRAPAPRARRAKS